jgi:hypothetical protein
MDCNLPELLARDLEMSNDIFMSNCNMSAGAPSLSIPRGDTDRHYSFTARPTSPHEHTLSRVRSAGVVGSISRSWGGEPTKWLGQQQGDQSVSDGGEVHVKDAVDFSDDTSQSSFEMEPPSVRFRQQSVTTAATSVTSGRCSSALSHKALASPIEVTEGSWMELDADFTHRPLNHPSPPRHRSASSASTGSPSKRVSRLTTTPEMSTIPIPRRRSSLRASSRGPSAHSRQSSTVIAGTNAKDAAQFGSDMALRHDQETMSSPFVSEEATAPFPSISRNPLPRITADDSATYHSGPAHTPQLRSSEDGRAHESYHPIYECRQPAATHTHNVRSWLESSIDISYRPPWLARTMTPPAVIVPREIIETLRVSVACFPDTMLVPGSFSIETIRSYARKMRRQQGCSGLAALYDSNPVEESRSAFSSPDAPAGRSKRWRLPSLLTSRSIPNAAGWSPQSATARAHLISPTSQSTSSPLSPCPSSTSIAGTAPTAARRLDGLHIKTIFPSAEPYLCDALYAHVVAYNYISSICSAAGSVVTSPAAVPRTAAAPSANYTDDEDDADGGARRIPTKAATLLGISNGRDRTAPNAGFRSFGTPQVSGPTSSSNPALDAALVGVRDGLAGCIAKLVSTLKLTTGLLGDTCLGTEASRDVDPLFMRTLCEMVRCAEESSW